MSAPNFQLPASWATVAARELVQFNPKTEIADETICGFVPMQALGTTYRSIMRIEPRIWGEVRKSYTHFQNGDVLVAKVTPCFENGKSGIAQGLPNNIGAGSSEFCVFRPVQGVDARYLLSWFSTEDFRHRAAVAMTGSVGLKRVPKDIFLEEIIRVAPENEQRRIAAKLDTVLARVDSVQDRLARVAPLLKRFRQSVLAAATSGQLTEDWREKNRINKKEDQWRRGTLKSLGKVSTGLTPSKLRDDFYTGNIPFVKPADLDNGTIFKTKETLTLEGSNAARNVRAGAVFVSCIGNLGKVGRAGIAMAFNQQINAIEFNSEKVTDKFGYYSCMTLGGWLRDNSSATTIAIVNKGRFQQAEINIPPLDEQTEIVRRVETLFAFADRLEARLKTAQTAANRLTPALLAKAFRGELVPQDPNDEPAAELLRRLRETRAADSASKPKSKRKQS